MSPGPLIAGLLPVAAGVLLAAFVTDASERPADQPALDSGAEVVRILREHYYLPFDEGLLLDARREDLPAVLSEHLPFVIMTTADQRARLGAAREVARRFGLRFVEAPAGVLVSRAATAPLARPSIFGRLLSIEEVPAESLDAIIPLLEAVPPDQAELALETTSGRTVVPAAAPADGERSDRGLDIRDEGARLVVQVFEFRAGETRAAIEAALAAAGADLRILLVDLRSAAGGDLGAAADVASLLLPDATPIAILEPPVLAGGLIEARGEPGLPPGLAVAVLVSPWTASAAEILAQALAGQDRITVVGRPTRGKCVVQRVIELGDGELTIPIAEAIGPGGEHCHGVGVVPDVVVPEPQLFDDDWLLGEVILLTERPRVFQCRQAEEATDLAATVGLARSLEASAIQARANVVVLTTDPTGAPRICLGPFRTERAAEAAGRQTVEAGFGYEIIVW